MEPFLSIVAKDLLNKFGSGIQDITIIFPSRRASLFFNKYLSENTDKPLWQPLIGNISDMMYSTAQLKPTDPLLLCYKLFEQYIKTTQRPETFDEFYFWGNVMLSDFDQIDKYLVDSKKIYSNIKDIKDIDRQFESLDEEQQKALENYLNVMTDSISSQIRSRYSEIWDKLGSIYECFSQSLISEKVAYDGLAYRIAANKIQQSNNQLFSGQYAIVGFNALNSCEKVLFQHLKTYNDALFYWDYDNYYMQPSNGANNEAALFMHDNLKQFPNQLGNEHFNNFSNKNINLIASPSNVAQAKLIPKILAEFTANKDQIGMNTAIILPEEQLLLPVLSALPENLEHLNITMAYPVRNTSAYTLVDYLLGLQSNVRNSANTTKFYHKDVLNILGHPYIKQISPNTDKLIHRINEHKLITIDIQEFAEDSVLSEILSPCFDTKQLSKYLSNIVSLVAAKISSDQPDAGSNKLELEFLFTMYKALNRLNDIIPQISSDFTPKTYRALFRKAMAEQRVSFIGEPLTGLQIMGFLETRNLDFDNIIILSLNDNILPGVTHSPSFIMPTLRTAFGLPDYRHQNAMFAYYFYRILQRAKNINLVYTNLTEGTKLGEMSRYILQILLESKLNINRIEAKFNLGQTVEPEISIKKTDEIIERLLRYTDTSAKSKFLSPTALATYKNCKLRFFFNKIAGFVEPDDMEETVDSRGIGTILHKAIELIYSSIDGEITESKLAKLNNDQLISSCINQAFAHCYHCDVNKIDDILIGRNKLILERVRWMIKKTIETDKQRVPYGIVSHEERIETTIPITVDDKTLGVKIGGYADRIEKKGNKLRIVDFKTGTYNQNKVKFKEPCDLFEKKELDGVFQLMVYSEIYSKMHNISPNQISQNLWFVRNNALPLIYVDGDTKSVKVELDSYEPIREQFMEELKNLITELFDRNTDFTQTDNVENCRICPYIGICGK